MSDTGPMVLVLSIENILTAGMKLMSTLISNSNMHIHLDKIVVYV